MCLEDIINHPDTAGGVNEYTFGPKVVDIDESKFFYHAYHRGRWRAGHWVFGAERELGGYFF